MNKHIKYIIAVTLVAFLVFSLCSCGLFGPKEKGDENIKIGDYSLKYKECNIVKDYNDSDALAVTLDFTNNSKNSAAFIWSVFTTAKQGENDLEQTDVFIDEDSFASLSDSTLTEANPGETIEVTLVYALADRDNPVKIEFSNLWDTQKATITLDLANAGNAVPAVNKNTSSATDSETDDASETDNSSGIIEDDRGLAALYPVHSMEINGTYLSYADMLRRDLVDGTYIRIDADYSGELGLNGSDPEEFMLDKWYGTLTFDDGTVLYFTEEREGVISISFPDQDDMTIYFALESVERETEETSETFPDGEFNALYAGDWHGMAVYYGCTGDYEENNDEECEIIARFIFDVDGYCTPYIALALGGENEYNFDSISVTYDSYYSCMFMSGIFLKETLTEDSFIQYDDEYGVLYISAELDTEDGMLKMFATLRRLDEEWDYENDYPALSEDSFEFYKGKSFTNIADLFELDLNAIPNDGGSSAETANVSSAEMIDDEGKGYGKSNAYATGIATLEDMRTAYAAIHESKTSASDTFNYESMRKILGSDGIPWYINESTWSDTRHSYKWESADGDFLYITFTIEDGNEWYISCTFSSSVSDGIREP